MPLWLFITVHLIKAIAAYETRSTCGIILPRATGNLLDLWARYPSASNNPQLVEWFFLQFRGIISGLAALHNHVDNKADSEKSAAHGTLNIGNILWFSGDDLVDVDSQFGHLVIGGTGEKDIGYLFPLYEVLYLGKWDPQAGDVASIGHIFLECMIWLLFGYDELKTFHSVVRALPGNVLLIRGEIEAKLIKLEIDGRCATGTPLGEVLSFVKSQVEGFWAPVGGFSDKKSIPKENPPDD
ncbi:hypothetical protein F4810DRAFT_665451 [Camillea tinctor]|nr:hypothetical protein F4810DRAFT_665451 [Camillea tinctor]